MTDTVALMAGTEDDIAEVQTRTMEDAGELLKQDWRDEILKAGLGQKLANTIRSRSFPGRGRRSLDPAAWVDTKAPKIIDAYSRGVTVVARNGRWLAWQTPAAGAKRVTPRDWERRTGLKLRFVPLRGGKAAYLVVDNARVSGRGVAKANTGTSRAGGKFTRLTGRTTVVVFTLQRSVRVRKAFDLDQLANRAAARIPGLMDRHWALMAVERVSPMWMDDNGRPIARPTPRKFTGGFS